MKRLFRTLKTIAFWLVLMAAIIVVKIEYMDRFLAGGLTGLIYLMAPIYLCAKVVQILLQVKFIAPLLDRACLFLFLLIVAEKTLEGYQESAAMETAKPIIEAVERFHAAHNSYPKTMAQLVPVYLHDIPGTRMMGHGDRHYYLTEFEDKFVLAFGSTPFGTKRMYDFKAKEWTVLIN